MVVPSTVKLTRHGQGGLGAADWGKEGDGLYASARHLWATAIVRFRQFERLEDIRIIRKIINRRTIINRSFPRASMLLIGYCVEMYLKGGLTKLLIGCADDVFRSTLKSYSHDLEKLAKDLIPDLNKTQRSDLRSLSKLVLNDARYPVEANSREEYVKLSNKRASTIHNGTTFRRYCQLAKHLRARIALIDADSNDPCSTSHWRVDVDGYLCYRYGGHVLPRMTYRRCTSADLTEEVTYEEVLTVIKNAGLLLPGAIETYAIYADQVKNGKRMLKKLTARTTVLRKP
ncbi:hypothetical protein V2K05_10400 [Pseudomonas alliivorans]|nr:hypothetical protein [Pseudomonas alliivorans]MEE4973720.1 hypothetical protein [Pseudomonas alliivorans]MEE4976445.1 hypothetical protein [Pseudomonas alliivorans]MEE4981057.1 hypothetical protein [Pseudomonas alliivorans]MEE5002252.1 hypothetical protein [Pseudomonas alliivorans]